MDIKVAEYIDPIEIRALPNAPNGYTPVADNCPSVRPTIRSASGLSRNETSWLELRRNKTVDPMRDFLGRINITGFDAGAYISDNAKNVSALPNIGIAVSGGGYRALLNGGKLFVPWWIFLHACFVPR